MGPKNNDRDRTNPLAAARVDKTTTRPFAKLLWILAVAAAGMLNVAHLLYCTWMKWKIRYNASASQRGTQPSIALAAFIANIRVSDRCLYC